MCVQLRHILAQSTCFNSLRYSPTEWLGQRQRIPYVIHSVLHTASALSANVVLRTVGQSTVMDVDVTLLFCTNQQLKGGLMSELGEAEKRFLRTRGEKLRSISLR